MPLPKAYQQMRRDQPELVRTYEALGEACRKAGPLDAKSTALAKLAIALGAGLEGASHSAVRKALGTGCTAEELLHVVHLATTTIGFPAMMRARTWVLDIVEDKHGGRHEAPDAARDDSVPGARG
jgi:alkylhydroperoxidase/carboxymuconolactone decarboxylase family protein YurZ